MDNLLTRLWRTLTGDDGWRDVRRTVPDPVFGELTFEGRRRQADGVVSGFWKVTYPPAGITQPISVAFPRGGETPAPDELAQLLAVLRDLDGLFERCRPMLAPEYEVTREEPLPADWRAEFRLDNIDLPDPEEEEPTLQVSYWCEGVLHWYVVTFSGETVIDVRMEG